MSQSVRLITGRGLGPTWLSSTGPQGGGRVGTKGSGNGPLSPPLTWTVQARLLLIYEAPSRSSALREPRADRCS